MNVAIFGFAATLVAIIVFSDTASVWKATGAVWLAVLALIFFAAKTKADMQGDTQAPGRRDGPNNFTCAMQWILSGLSRFMQPQSADDTPAPEQGFWAKVEWWTTPRAADLADRKKLSDNPWSWPVLQTALRLAVFYPILLAMAQWAATAQATGMAGVTLFPTEPRDLVRYGALGLMTFLILERIMASARPQSVSEDEARWVLAIAVAVGGVLVVTGGLLFIFSGAAAYALAFTGIVVGVILGPIAAGIAFLMISTATFAVAATSIAAFAFAPVFAFATAFAFVSAGNSAFAFACALAGGIAGVACVSFLCQRRAGLPGYLIFGLGLLLALMLAAAANEGFEDDPRPASVFLFLGLLPLVNALFDWLSYGLTIRLIRAGFQRKSLWTLVFGLADVIAAACMFLALGAALIALIGWLNQAMAQPVFDLAGLLIGLKQDPWAHFWVIGMVFSTFLPTVVHLVVALASALTWLPVGLRDWLHDGIAGPSQSGWRFMLASLTTSALWTAYAALMSLGLVALALGGWTLTEAAGAWYLEMLTAWARMIGAI